MNNPSYMNERVPSTPEALAKQWGLKHSIYRRSMGVSGFQSHTMLRIFTEFLRDTGYEVVDVKRGEVFYIRAQLTARKAS